MASAEENRNRFPLAATLVDSFRKLFGDDTRITYAKNAAGDTIGKQESGWLPWQDWPTHVDSVVPRLGKRK